MDSSLCPNTGGAAPALGLRLRRRADTGTRISNIVNPYTEGIHSGAHGKAPQLGAHPRRRSPYEGPVSQGYASSGPYASPSSYASPKRYGGPKTHVHTSRRTHGGSRTYTYARPDSYPHPRRVGAYRVGSHSPGSLLRRGRRSGKAAG